MRYEFDPFSPDPNSESYLPDPENPSQSKLRLWIHGYNLKRRYSPKKNRARRRRRRDSFLQHQADLAQYMDLGRTTESTEPGEMPFILVGWEDHLPGISEDEEIRHWTGETMSDPGHDSIDSEDASRFSGSPRKWYTFH
ncbi:hypothetical protein MSAN_02339300 [Mycena sanguinolenta]|uniref:Uncharacterized protein n=1 Tax=Mycena sanguinolenta TaxID=230812 RepID=A0A8H6X722_9AGAR|nr:hypothetical protein MSAN_02339300 [Mycena sanguinolenta]